MTATIQPAQPHLSDVIDAADNASISVLLDEGRGWILTSPAGCIRVPDLATAADRIAEGQAYLEKHTGEFANALDSEFLPADAVATVERLCRGWHGSEFLFLARHCYLLAARRIAEREGIRAPFATC